MRPMNLRAGKCVAIAAAGDEGVEDVDVLLRDASGRLVASDSGPAPYAAVRRCAQASESLEAQVVLYRGEGDVAVRILGGTP